MMSRGLGLPAYSAIDGWRGNSSADSADEGSRECAGVDVDVDVDVDDENPMFLAQQHVVLLAEGSVSSTVLQQVHASCGSASGKAVS